MKLGDRIKRRREELSMTQQDLANRAEMQRSHIGAIEAGSRMTVTSDVLLRLARALRCSADDLIGTFEGLGKSESSKTEDAALAIV